MKKKSKLSWGWRYIVIVRDGTYQIHEGYGFNKQGIPHSWTDDPIAPMGESLLELRLDLFQMALDAATQPVFEEHGKKLRKV